MDSDANARTPAGRTGFVLWLEAGEPGVLRGVLERVSDSERRAFDSSSDLVAILRASLGEIGGRS
ncbi:MAG: hypothetical protein H6748_07565 [Spirochaetaceae bacterium]|nr:hypothetical protein [Myxococcales bacterium]MCB9723885.1 hypothetical protein [Spirochaetaceae bacterium]HPG24946.1 hypothetical protein [Myxococcota bacterium]